MNTPALTPPPDPLPVQWQRAIANDITEHLRRGWQKHRATRPYRPPHSRDYQGASPIPPPAPTSELLWNEPYTRGLIEPNPAITQPWIAWQLTKDAHDQALHNHPSQPILTAFIITRPTNGQTITPYRATPNRHGATRLRRNADYALPEIDTALTLLVTAATIWLPDPLDVLDAISEQDTINAEALFTTLEYDT